MSSELAYVLPVRSPRREQPERRIEIVSTRAQRRARPRPLYAMVAIAGLFALFMAQLLLSIAVSDGAYQISELKGTQAELARTQQSLSEQVDTLASTQNLASKAEALGMVQSSATPAFLNATTGTIVGKSHAVSNDSTGVLDSTGNLVPNSLLPDNAVDSTTDDTTTDAATATTTGATEDPTVDAIDTGASSGATTGAPSTSTTTTSVQSNGGLPVPVTH